MAIVCHTAPAPTTPTPPNDSPGGCGDGAAEEDEGGDADGDDGKGRQPGFAQYLNEANAGQRRVCRGFDDGGAARRHRRSNLVDNKVERVIERAHGDDHADGFFLRKRDTSCRCRSRAQRSNRTGMPA